MIKLKSLLESDDSIYIDRFGSLPSRPKNARFKNANDYNAHMGFDAALTGEENYTQEQIKTVKELMKRGFVISGHSKMPDTPNQVEILMTKQTKTGGSEYRDVLPNGKIS